MTPMNESWPLCRARPGGGCGGSGGGREVLKEEPEELGAGPQLGTCSQQGCPWESRRCSGPLFPTPAVGTVTSPHSQRWHVNIQGRVWKR